MSVFDSTTGALEIGVLVSAILFGVMMAQSYTYFKTFPKDRLWIKLLVIVVWCLELAHTICAFQALYVDTVTGFGHTSILEATPMSLDVSIIFLGLVDSVVQSYFVHRVYMLTRRRLVLAVLVTLQLVSFVSKMGVAVTAIISTHDEYLREYSWLAIVSMVVGCTGDVSVTTALVYSLAVRKSDAFRSTRIVVDKLILWTIETGTISSAIGVAMLICILTLEHTYIWLALMMVVPKVYSNNLLASLNSRANLRAIHEQEIVIGCTEICAGIKSPTQNDAGTLEFRRFGGSEAITSTSGGGKYPPSIVLSEETVRDEQEGTKGEGAV